METNATEASKQRRNAWGHRGGSNLEGTEKSKENINAREFRHSASTDQPDERKEGKKRTDEARGEKAGQLFDKEKATGKGRRGHKESFAAFALSSRATTRA